MPSLFTLPKQIPLSSAGLLLPGAKLTFSQTGTSTLQNTYQDIGLTTPHANPVVADASGVFAPIYLDPSLPHYRVKLTTSADVQVYQVDDVPSNQNAAQTFRLSAAAPSLIFHETGVSDNNSKWKIGVNAETLTFSLLNDSESVETVVFELTRSGTGIANYNFLPGGAGLMNYKGQEVASVISGTFNGTWTGFSTSPFTTQIAYTKIQSPAALGIIHLSIPGTLATSNATTWTITGLPAAVAPANGTTAPIIVQDNGTDQAGVVFLTTGAPTVLTFGRGVAAGGFTASGSKGLPSQYITLTYTGAS